MDEVDREEEEMEEVDSSKICVIYNRKFSYPFMYE